MLLATLKPATKATAVAARPKDATSSGLLRGAAFKDCSTFEGGP